MRESKFTMVETKPPPNNAETPEHKNSNKLEHFVGFIIALIVIGMFVSLFFLGSSISEKNKAKEEFRAANPSPTVVFLSPEEEYQKDLMSSGAAVEPWVIANPHLAGTTLIPGQMNYLQLSVSLTGSFNDKLPDHVLAGPVAYFYGSAASGICVTSQDGTGYSFYDFSTSSIRDVEGCSYFYL